MARDGGSVRNGHQLRSLWNTLSPITHLATPSPSPQTIYFDIYLYAKCAVVAITVHSGDCVEKFDWNMKRRENRVKIAS